MANLGIIDADPSEPPCDEEVVQLANRLLTEFNIPTTIEDIGDICAALFVLLYENLFSDRLSGIIRQPVSKEDEIHNCQTVIDVLSTDIVHDSLTHIRGVDIVEGDITAISNLLDIFSYLLDYVANRIESDIATDNEDGKSWTMADQDSYSKEKSKKFDRQAAPKPRSVSSRSEQKKTTSQIDLIGRADRRSPELNTNDNRSSQMNYDKYSEITRAKVMSPSYGDDKLDTIPDYLDMPPSPIRPDQSQSLLGQKTVDSTELDSELERGDRDFMKAPSAPKVAWEDRVSPSNICEQKVDGTSDAVVGGVASSTAAVATTPAMTGSTAAASSSLLNGLSSTMPPPQPTTDDNQDVPLRSTIGPIDYHRTQTDRPSTKPDRESDPTLVKGLSTSYNDLRHLVERTAAMTRVALQTSPILGRLERELDLTDTTPRPTIPSDGARLAKELNAQGMRRREAELSSHPKNTKKVAFSSHTDGHTDSSYRYRYPLEELSDNDYGASNTRKEDNMYNGKEEARRIMGYDGGDNLDVGRNYISRPTKTSASERRRPKKSPTKTEAFASHLARSRQPELGAAHLKLKTEDRAIKKKQEFLQRMYEEDLGEFSEDVRALLKNDHKKSQDTEKEMLKSYQQSKPLVKGAQKTKSTSKSVSYKKPKLGTKVVTSKPKRSPSPTRSSSPLLKLESEEDLLPYLLENFPHLYLSEHTWHELCRKGLHQIEGVTRAYQENKRKKSRAQIQMEEAARKHEILSDIMRKELDHKKRLRDIKEQKGKQIQLKNMSHERRVQSARARRYYNEYQVRARSKQLKRRTKEEMVFRDLFKDALNIQKERIKDIRQYSSDQRKCQESRRRNEIESQEHFFQDQFMMLAEKLAQERKDKELRDKAQQQMIHRMKQELRKKVESEIRLYQEQLFRDDDDAHFRQMDADKVKRQLHLARYAAQI